MAKSPLPLILFGLSLFAGPAAGSPAFSIQEAGGKWWLTKPSGEHFFSLGVCVVDQGASPGQFCSTNPGYASFQHYTNAEQWTDSTLHRLTDWHFTTVGGWSDFAALRQCSGADVAFIPVLAVGMSCGAPWWDMWNTNLIARMHQIAHERIAPLRDDPRVLGYYTDNEMGWWNAALLKLTLQQPAPSAQKQRLLRLLRTTYHNRWPELLKDFDPVGADSFDALERSGMLYLRPGSRGIRVYRQFLYLMAQRYYALARESIRTCDSRGLILGDRYQSFYYPEVARAAAGEVDAVSSNLNAAWNDGSFPRFYLDTLHVLSGRPILVSEFYLTAQQNRSGDPNSASTFPVVATQAERAAGFRNTLEALARLPWVVGADWFQYYDEPPFGRGDGENYNFGLVDIHNEPYAELTETAQTLDLAALKNRTPSARPDARLGVPPAPAEPLGHFSIRLALEDWDRERGFVPPASLAPVADLYVCWSPKAVYLGVYAQDIVELDYYRNKQVPAIDRAEWIISTGRQRRPIHVRLGPGGPPLCDDPVVRVANLAGVYMNTRNIAALELPAELFGKASLASGDVIRFASTFFTHCQADRVEWKGRFTLRN